MFLFIFASEQLFMIEIIDLLAPHARLLRVDKKQDINK
jgi:hypothetical protein